MHWVFRANLEDAPMNQAVLQILLLLAYLAIGLIAVTFPIYAISVNYLPQEKSESEKERKKRIEKLRENIENLTNELSGGIEDAEHISQITEQIGRYKTELEGTELKAGYLTAKGAVRNPIISLVLALLTAGIGVSFWIVDEMSWVIAFGFVSGGLSVAALYSLYKTVSAVEYAALRPARTVDFHVSFKDGKETKQMTLNEETDVEIMGYPLDDSVDNATMYVTFPKVFETTTGSETERVHIDMFPNYWCVTTIATPHLPAYCIMGAGGSVRPVKTGEYRIPVDIHAKGVYPYSTYVTINVVEEKKEAGRKKAHKRT